MMWDWMSGSGWSWFGALWMAVFWVLAIWGIVVLSRRGGGDDSARAALDDRFARGDIDELEYRRSRELISR